MSHGETKQTRRLIFIDLLRAVACLWVLYCHFYAIWLDNLRVYGWHFSTLLVRIAGYGGKGVDLFIVISGFCLFYPVLKRSGKGGEFAASDFYLRRAKRILPVYYVTLAISVLLVSIPSLRILIAPYRGLRDVVPYLLMIHNHMPDYIGRINGPLWSVALECQLYLVMPIWVWLFMNKPAFWPLLLAGAVSLTASLMDLPSHTWGGIAPFSEHGMPARVFEFVAGMAAARWVLRPRGWHILAALVVIVCLSPLAVASQTRYGGRFLMPEGALFWGLIFASVIVLCARLEAANMLRHRWLSPLAGLGLISYSVYAIHFPILLMLTPLVHPLMNGVITSFLWATIIGLPVILGAGGVLFFLVERYSVPAVRREALVDALAAADGTPGVPAPAIPALMMAQ